MTLIEWLRAQGNAGAVANARTLIEQRRREDWLVQTLESRLPAAPPSPGAVSATAA